MQFMSFKLKPLLVQYPLRKNLKRAIPNKVVEDFISSLIHNKYRRAKKRKKRLTYCFKNKFKCEERDKG